MSLQWAESLFRELDYQKEAANGIRFKELYGNLEVDASLFNILHASDFHSCRLL